MFSYCCKFQLFDWLIIGGLFENNFKLSQSQSSKREIEQRIDEVRKGMLNAAEIAKQADAMLAEREQEMKELEQQKRRARDIMFKKTQQLKVCPR